MEELNDDFYCSAGYWKDGDCRGVRNNGSTFSYGSSAHDKDCSGQHCRNYHRKYPTPKQFKEEYGFDYPDENAVYLLLHGKWVIDDHRTAKQFYEKIKPKEVCACTPFGCPPQDWRPK